MKKIIISGEIGWDVWPEDIRRQFEQAAGEEVELHISSPGGYVYDGIEIFNIVKNYSGKVTAKLVGLAASMASYIPMAADKIVAESNAVFMIHNASTFARGDHHDLRHDADILEGFTNLLSKKYVEKSGKSAKEIRDLMDAESWYFGDEIKEAGFADEIVNIESAEDKTASVLTAKAQFKNLSAKMKRQEGRKDDVEKIAALLPKNKTVSTHQRKSPSDNSQTPKKGIKMNLEKFKAEHPDLYAQVFKEGQKAELKRVSGHATMAKETGAFEYALECIADSSKSVRDDDVFAKYQTARMKKQTLKDSVEDNAENTDTDKEDKTESKTEEQKKDDLVNAVMDRNKTNKQGDK